MDAGIPSGVRERAQPRCEYCGLPQAAVLFAFQIEHVIARQHRGSDDPSNLALACDRCNLHKGTNLSAIDPISGNIVAIFNPRKDRWHEHFELQGAVILGLTEVGRATLALLKMNVEHRVRLRTELNGVMALTPPKMG